MFIVFIHMTIAEIFLNLQPYLWVNIFNLVEILNIAGVNFVIVHVFCGDKTSRIVA